MTPVSPADLRAKARELDAAAAAALARGDATAMAVAIHQANTCRLAADELERLAGAGDGTHLRSRERTRNVNAPMFSAESRVNMSRGTNAPSARLAGLGKALKPPMSLAAIAEDAGISKGLLTMALKGDRSMPTAAAEKIKARTGYPLTAWKKLG